MTALRGHAEFSTPSQTTPIGALLARILASRPCTEARPPGRSRAGATPKRGCLHPYDHHGERIHPSALPAAIPHLKRDAYRDLAWSVREGGGFVKSEQPYSEFRWAQFFRCRIPRTSVLRDFEHAHDRAMMLARSEAASHLPGFIGIRI